MCRKGITTLNLLCVGTHNTSAFVCSMVTPRCQDLTSHTRIPTGNVDDFLSPSNSKSKVILVSVLLLCYLSLCGPAAAIFSHDFYIQERHLTTAFCCFHCTYLLSKSLSHSLETLCLPPPVYILPLLYFITFNVRLLLLIRLLNVTHISVLLAVSLSDNLLWHSLASGQ